MSQGYTAAQLEIRRRYLEKLDKLICETRERSITWSVVNFRIALSEVARELGVRDLGLRIVDYFVDGRKGDHVTLYNGTPVLPIREEDSTGQESYVFYSAEKGKMDNYDLMGRPFLEDPEINDKLKELVQLIEEFSGSQP